MPMRSPNWTELELSGDGQVPLKPSCWDDAATVLKVDDEGITRELIWLKEALEGISDENVEEKNCLLIYQKEFDIIENTQESYSRASI